MVSDRTIERLQDAGDLLGLLEEIVAGGEPSRLALAGMRVAIRNAREGIVRSYLELKQGQRLDARSPIRPESSAVAPHIEQPDAGEREAGDDPRILNRRRDLRTSVEKIVERNL